MVRKTEIVFKKLFRAGFPVVATSVRNIHVMRVRKLFGAGFQVVSPQ